MGLRDEIQADIAEAFDDEDGLADAVEPLRGRRTISTDDYDVDVGGYAEETLTYRGRGVFGSFSQQIVDQSLILSTDVKVTILQSELVGADGQPITPAVDDYIDGLKVIDVQQDPARVTWSLQCRGTRTPPLMELVLVDRNNVVLTDLNGNVLVEAA
ncbi:MULTISPECIES: glutamate 5-kinase [unclassified Halomonas]|uniref:glutamate 5-kinase n=1 Tax=unclassified Halomonas TaxID=2609666 RepID=UPI00207697BC|nr:MULTISPECIES: glutamate 5-kinase [unclassified Halomonas]